MTLNALIITILISGILGFATNRIMKKIRSTFIRRRIDLEKQSILMTEFVDLAENFNRRTNKKEIPLMREMLSALPCGIYSGAFANAIVFARGTKLPSGEKSKVVSQLMQEQELLSKTQIDQFMKAGGTALLASTYANTMVGSYQRRAISMMMDKDTRQVGSQEVITRGYTVSSEKRLELCA